jgi:hypothetical protein
MFLKKLFVLLVLFIGLLSGTAQTFPHLHSFVFTNGTGPVAGLIQSG